MSEVGVGAADRSRLLRSKRADLSGIVTSRKRKLREFFAVCDNEAPVPQISFSDPDAPPTSAAEAHFLDLCDVLQDRLFDEAHLPTRRQLRSGTSKQPSPVEVVSPDSHAVGGSRKATKVRKDGSRSMRSRATTPSTKSEGGQGAPENEESTTVPVVDGVSMQRSTSKGSQTDLPAESKAILDEIVEETFENAAHEQPPPRDHIVPPKDLESDRIRTGLESRPGSPGVDPREAMPITAEDAANLSEPLIEGLGSHAEHHKALTAHLPPREVQERHLRQSERAREQKDQVGRLSINLPPRDGGKAADPLSSPGSTVGGQSAATPALHEASTDTSPDNESSRYEPERLENKEDDPQTPPELRHSAEEIAEKEEHDRILKAQIEISRAEILGSSPSAADAQLRMEEEAASLPADREAQSGDSQAEEGSNDDKENPDGLTQGASEAIQDAAEEEEDEVVGVPTPGDEAMSGVEEPAADTKEPEVADSEASKDEAPVDSMDVDSATVQDSFESKPSVTTPAAQEPEDPSPDDAKKASPDVPVASTPRQAPSTPAASTPAVERMTTRVASGAMKHKSVSEILGEIPRPNTTSGSERSGKGATDSDSAVGSNSPSRSTTPQSPGTRIRSMMEKAKEKERSKLSTVVFAKQPSKQGSTESALTANGSKSAKVEDDYFTPLFLATTAMRGAQTLDQLLQSAHKTITTSNAYVPIHENQTAKVLKRIYNLQSSNKWSLRQPKRSQEPNRPTTHWDVLLQEAKWMRTDFREERKWKMTVCRNMAYDCAEWFAASPEDRKQLQVRTKPPQRLAVSGESSKDEEMGDVVSSQEGSHPTPDLVASAEFDSPMDDDEEPRLNLLETVSPTAIFGLQDDDVVFGLRRSPTTDKLLDELPMYGAPLSVPQSELPTSELDPDRFWRRPALPLSKYVEGRMELKIEGPPRKKSRYQYEDEDDDEDLVVFGEQGSKRIHLEPEQTDVALFNPENKHIRDRIHAGHQFRPPSEYPMPLQSFFECRTASQWTWAEDDELKGLVREYSYNWSLISSMLTSRSLFSSGAERRTPWECFERWIHLEGLPADMQKTHYFRAYNNRLEAAQRNLMAQAAQAPQQPNAAGQVTPARRRTTTSVRVERRRNQKHLTLVDAMRKLAKKRETSLQKQQHAAGLAAMRKANEVPQARAPIHTPQDFSRLKHEREEQVKERMIQFQQRQEAQRRAAIMQQRNAQNPQQQGVPNGVPQQRGPAPVNGMAPNGQPNVNGQNLAVPGQNRPRTSMPPQMGGPIPIGNNLQIPQMTMNGVPQAQMAMPGQQRLPIPNPSLDINLVTQARRISEQQRQAVQMQQQGQHPNQSSIHNSPPRMNGMSQPGFIPNNMMPPFNPNGTNGTTPPANGLPMPSPGSAGSPRMGMAGVQQLSNGMVPQVSNLEAQIRSKYPNATSEQVRHMVSDTLSKNMHQRGALAQSAMNAAAGGNGMGNVNAGVMANGRVPSGVENSPQLYAQMLRAQQLSQQQAAQAASSGGANANANLGGGNVNGQQQQQAQRASSSSSNGTQGK